MAERKHVSVGLPDLTEDTVAMGWAYTFVREFQFGRKSQIWNVREMIPTS